MIGLTGREEPVSAFAGSDSRWLGEPLPIAEPSRLLIRPPVAGGPQVEIVVSSVNQSTLTSTTKPAARRTVSEPPPTVNDVGRLVVEGAGCPAWR